MEQDRYKQNHSLYIIGMSCLVLSIVFIMFSAFIAPALLFDWKYDTPFFIHRLTQWYALELDISDKTSQLIVLLQFFIPGVLFSVIAYLSSKKIENEIYEIEEPEEEKDEIPLYARTSGDISLGLKILGLMILVVLIALFAEYLVYLDTNTGYN